MIIKPDSKTKVSPVKTQKKDEPQHSLIFPSNYEKCPNYRFIRDNLINSNLFSKIEYKPLLTRKQQQTFIIDGIPCLIDISDSPRIDRIISSGMANIQFIFILQFCLSLREYYLYLSKKFNIHILPLTYGFSGLFSLAQFHWQNKKHKYLANFSFGTSGRSHREKWIAEAKQNGNFSLEHASGQKYVDCLKECKWGVSLKGFGVKHDGKCYRETEFLSFGMPLALAYKPYYAFPFIANVHYLYLKNPDMLNDLSSIDPRPFAKQSKMIWEKYYSPVGFTNLLFSIIYDEEYRNSVLGFSPEKAKIKIDIQLDRIKCRK